VAAFRVEASQAVDSLVGFLVLAFQVTVDPP
jgi:hypothetical protein